MHFRFYLLLVLCCILSFSLFAKETSNVRRFSPNEGLAQSYVTGLLVDKNGYLWIGTEAGVNRYDGYQLSTMTGAEGKLRDKSIDFLYEDKQNDIWISTTYSGLYRYDTDTFQLERVLEFKTDRSHSPLVMLETHQPGFYWLGRTRNLALLNSHTGEVKHVFEIPGDFKYAYVRALKYYKHYLLIGTSEGVYVMDTNTQKVVELKYLNEPARHHDQNNAKSFHIVGSQLWLGTVQGLHTVELDNIERLVAGELEKLPSEVRISDLNIWKIMPFKSGLKLATNQGVYNYFADDDQLIKSTELDNSDYELSDNSIVDMLISDDGSMWLASKSDGAYFIAKNNYLFQNYNRDTLYGGLSHNNVWSMVEHNKDVWLATSDGITKINPHTYQSQTYLEGYLADRINHEFHVYQIFENNNILWLSTSRGFFKFDLATLTISAVEVTVEKYKDIFQKQLIVGHFSQNGEMYFKSFKHGYFKFNTHSQELIKIEPAIPVIDDTLSGYFLPPMKDEQLPFFFHSKSLYQLLPDNSVKHLYTPPVKDDVEYLEMTSYVVDNNGVMWLSYYSYGLVGLDSMTFEEKYRIEDKLDTRGSLFYSLTKDERGMIWMASHSGIWRFNPNTQHFRQYSVDDGIAVNEFNSGAKLTYSDGRIIFGSIKGITSFHPERNDINEQISERVNITSITLMSRKLEAESIIQQNLLELDYDDIGLEIGFSAMLFKYQDRIEYEYQLDDSPLVSTDNNKVAFARIAPGKHTFNVRARDPLNGNYTDFKSFTIQVHYPPWRSPAAFAIYFVLIASFISVWFLRRHRYQQRLLAAHRQSRENEMRLKLALESSQSGVWEWQSGVGDIYQPRLCNELGFDKFNVTLDEYLAKIHPDDRAKYRIEWLEFVTTQKAYFNLTYRVRHNQGHWRWYKDVGRVIEWDGDLPQRVTGTYTNFTRERDLESSARLFSAAFEHTRDWVFVMDSDFKILAINKALRESHQFDINKDSSRKLSLGLSAKRRTQYLRELAKLNAGEHYQSEETITNPEGEQFKCLIKVTAVANERAEVDNFVVVITDISSL
ncbi:two-component regulator propeller domain-containing protein [Pseudoalteromonas sp.]|uniref:two-component regulator propeller domain-containing protein n=1 Tax=Pseudoalteromonas sp. TaxID=53249 RepID=UPI003568FA7D